MRLKFVGFLFLIGVMTWAIPRVDAAERYFERLNSPEFQAYLDELSAPIRDSHHHYTFRPHNQFTVLIDGIMHRHETIATVRDARLFLNISQLELYGDRFGYILGVEIIAQLLPDYNWLLQGKKGRIEDSSLNGDQKKQERFNNIRKIATKLETSVSKGISPYLPNKKGEYRFLENQKTLADIERLQRTNDPNQQSPLEKLKRDWVKSQLEVELLSDDSQDLSQEKNKEKENLIIQKILSDPIRLQQEFLRLSEENRTQLKKVPDAGTFLREAKNLKNEYIALKLKASGLSEVEQQEILSSSKKMDQFLLDVLPPLETRLLLDPLKTYFSWKITPLRALLPALKLFGVKYRLINQEELWKFPLQLIPVYGVNHAKIVSNESRAIVSGGNIIDKVMGFNRRNLVWHDVAVLIKGQLVNDITRFFGNQFNAGIVDEDRFPMERLDQRDDPWGKECQRNETKLARSPGNVGGGRLIYTVPVTSVFTGSITERTFKAIVKHSKHKLQIENAFFSDAWAARLLIQKAKKWKLNELKNSPEQRALGEAPKKATCGPGSVAKLAQRGKSITVILPKNMDQPLIKMAEAALINPMVRAGIDVCKWSGKQFNEQHPDPKKRRYKEDTMLHTKALLADDEIGQIGSPNQTRRSYRGDLELAVLFTEPSAIRDLKEKVMDLDQENSEPAVWRWVNLPGLIPTLGFNLLQVF